MARGDKSAYSPKQKRQAEHIEEGYEHRGMPEEQAERIAWATVNKETGGAAKTGHSRASSEHSNRNQDSGTTKRTSNSGTAANQKRSEAAKKGWETRRRQGNA